MNIFTPVYGSYLSKYKRKDAIISLMLLAKKRDGRIKGRACVNCCGKRGKPEKEDVASPTVAIESIFIISALDAHGRRDLATIDIPGALIHADSDDHIIMLLKVKLALLMCYIATKL